jgi:hypothetical protein
MGKGILKAVEGVIEADGEKIIKGVYGTATSAVGTVVTHTINEEIGKAISDHGEQASDD